jgi:hypothetical protein
MAKATKNAALTARPPASILPDAGGGVGVGLTNYAVERSGVEERGADAAAAAVRLAII